MMQIDQVNTDLILAVDFQKAESLLCFNGVKALTEEFPVTTDIVCMSDGLRKLSSQVPDDDTDDPLVAYKARRAKARAAWAAAEQHRLQVLLGISAAVVQRKVDATLLGRGLMAVRREGGDVNAFLAAVFDWRLAAQQRETESELLIRLGVPSGTPEDEESDELEMVQNELIEAGIYSAPAFILRGQCFQGREHLPLIRWYLSGETGLPPV